jgi:glycosyltransferase involved in cell wall biosynthesis
MKRPTIALAMIMKNEAHNLGPLLQSVSGCFDAIFLTDTGSTDNSVEIALSEKSQEVAGCPIYVNHFEWVHDFSKARQFNFDQVGKEFDYIMWMDLDDVLSDKEAFKHFRDHTMHGCQQWLVYYNYAFENGKPVCTFFRERIVKNNFGFKWKYFLHEGLVQTENRKTHVQLISTFTIDHQRTATDIAADKRRNIHIFERHAKESQKLEPRMEYYYGKELFDAGDFVKSAEILQNVCSNPHFGIELHDRVMAQQFLAMAYAQMGKFEHSLNVALNGLQLEPSRAEFFIVAGDALVNMGKPVDAINYYEAAKRSKGGDVNGAIYSSPLAQVSYPSHQLAQIYIKTGQFNLADKELKAIEHSGFATFKELRDIVDNALRMNQIPQQNELIQTDDIVFTTPPVGYVSEWDEKTALVRGFGGSETALIEVAKYLKEQTGRPVKVFTHRKTTDVMPSGVVYYPLQELEKYFKTYVPARHIAWRHAAKLTTAPTYVWSHDLVSMHCEYQQNYDKIWALSEFHKHFLIDLVKIDPKKIDVMANGIDPELFREKYTTKNPLKVIFSSSPDRGWKPAIEICKLARQKLPNLELHLFYSTANMRKAGLEAEANEFDRMANSEPWIHSHGMVDKKTLVKHFKESAVWLYPTDFLETFCITALEAICSGTYPLVRGIGALPYTLADAEAKGMCKIMEKDASCAEEYQIWADELVNAILDERWRRVEIDPDQYSWANATKHFIKSMDL